MPQTYVTERPGRAGLAADVRMKRTLLIGIGGSGKEVLIRFRLKMLETYGTLEKHEFIEYLWIDTDYNNKDINQMDFSKALQMAWVGDDDKVNASMKRSELKEFYDSYQRHGNYHSWFNKPYLEELGTEVLEQGASAMRPFGKLAFWNKFPEIDSKIQAKLRRLHGDFERPNISDPNDIDIYIVGSLAGGTGSGMFIDISAYLQQNTSNASRNGIFFLADVFDEVENMRMERESNCYAALQELDFYMTPDNKATARANSEIFAFNWDSGKSVKITLPLLTRVNLIGNTYENGARELKMSDAFNLAAEYLFLGFNESSFDGEVRAIRTNVIQGYNNKVHYIYGFNTGFNQQNNNRKTHIPFQTSYTSIALGTIEFNRRKIRNWAVYKFLSEFCEQILEQKNDAKTAYLDEDGQIKIQMLRSRELLDYLKNGETRISPADQLFSSIKKDIASKTSAVTQSLPLDISPREMENKRESIQSDIDKFMEERKRQVNEETLVDYSHTGKVILGLHDNLESAKSLIQREIFSTLINLLADYNRAGYLSGMDFLDKVNGALHAMDTFIIAYQKDLKKFNYIQPDSLVLPDPTEINDVMRNAAEANDIPGFFLFYRERAKKFFSERLDDAKHKYRDSLNNSISDYIQNHQNQLLGLLQSRTDNALVTTFKAAIQDIKDYLTDMKTNELNSGYKSTFTYAKEEFLALRDSYPLTRSDSESQRKLILDSYMIDEIQTEFNQFKDRMAQDNYGSFIQKVYEQIPVTIREKLQSESINPDPHTALTYMILKSIELRQDYDIDIKRLLKETARSIFEDFLKNKTVDSALMDLLNGTRGNEIKEMVKKVWEHSCMRLDFNSDPQINISRGRQRFSIDGIPDNRPLHERLKTIISDGLNPKISSYFEAIVFYREGSGFPITNLSLMRKLKNSLDSELRKDVKLMYKRYTSRHYEYLYDLISMNDEEFNAYQKNYQLAMKAVVLGKIGYSNSNGDDSKFKYEYTESGIPNTLPLGKRIETVAGFLANTQHRDHIIDNLDMRELTVQQCRVLHFALRKDLNPIVEKENRDYAYLQGDNASISLDRFVLFALLHEVEDTIKQKMSSEYPGPDEMNQYLEDKVFQFEAGSDEYTRLDYYTANFENGIYVLKSR